MRESVSLCMATPQRHVKKCCQVRTFVGYVYTPWNEFLVTGTHIKMSLVWYNVTSML